MPGVHYLDRSDAGLLAWSQNFASKISLAFADYGISQEESNDYGELMDAYALAYGAATDPQTRGTQTIALKDEAKVPLEAMSRRLAMVATNHPGVSNSQRQLLGLTQRKGEATPIPRPGSAPEVTVRSVVGRVVNLALRDPATGSRRKPVGVRGAWLFTHVGEEPPAELGAMVFYGTSTRSFTQVVFGEGVAKGAKVWVSACWVNPTDEPGPASLPVATWTNHAVLGAVG